MIKIVTKDYSDLSDYAHILAHQTARVAFAAKSSKHDDSELNVLTWPRRQNVE